MRILTGLVTLATAMLVTVNAQAQSPRPGLWEMKRTAAAGDPSAAHLVELQKKLSSLPPAQRKTMEDSLRTQGIAVGSNPGEMVSQVCITPEEAARFSLGKASPDNKCTRQPPVHVGSTVRVTQICPSSRIDSEFTFTGDTAYTGTLTITMQGQPTPMKTMLSGRWLSADCGKEKI